MISEQKTKNISIRSKIFLKITWQKSCHTLSNCEFLSRFFRFKTKKTHLLGKEY